MTNNQISVIAIVRNGAKYMARFIQSVQSDFDEIVILIDDRTSDATHEIIKGFPNVVVEYFTFDGFGFAKQKAANKAKNDWVLSLDVDEELDSESKKYLKTISLANENQMFLFKRINFYNGKHINGAGWNDDVVLRLFNKKHTNFANKHIHEYVCQQKNSTLIQAVGKINHYPYETISELVYKMNHYSDLFVLENINKKKSSVFKSIYKGMFAFFRDFVLDKGILYGYEGLTISITNACGTFYKYIKLYEAQKRILK